MGELTRTQDIEKAKTIQSNTQMASILCYQFPYLCFFWLYLHFSLSVSVSSWANFPLFSLFLRVHPFLWFHSPAFLSFILPLISTQACRKTSFKWKGPNKSLQASKCLWKNFLNVHIVTDISYTVCGLIHEYSETIKCFLHCATDLKINKKTEKNYYERKNIWKYFIVNITSITYFAVVATNET